MIRLVLGTPDSGKSKIAEEIVCSMDLKRYYLATMLLSDADAKKRAEKHRKNREGKGFITIEMPFRITEAIDRIEDGKNSVILLECMSNLIGNEIYDDPRFADLCKPSKEAASLIEESILEDIEKLNSHVRELVIVSNEFSYDGEDEMTVFYVALSDSINKKLIRLADEVTDVRKYH